MDEESQNKTAPVFKLARKPLPASRYPHPKAAVYENAGEHDSWGYSTIDEVSDQSNLTSPKERASPNLPSLEGRLPWLWESLSCGVAFIALAAIALTLGIHNNKPIPSWPQKISINSLVAIFSGILKAALLLPVSESISELKWIWYATPQSLRDFDYYDGASRGPFGSFLFLFRRPRNLLTSAAALITILALAIDPFTQQVLQYYNCSVPSEDVSALVSQVNVYVSTGELLSPETATPDVTMSSAIYRALYDPFDSNASFRDIPFSCITGNCSFPMSSGFTYRSLAMCSNVTDQSAHVKKVPLDPISQWIGNGTRKFAEAMNYTFGGLTAAYYGSASDPCMSLRLAVGDEDEIGGALVTMYALMVTSSCNGDESCPVTPLAFKASLYPCVKTFGAVNVSDSRLHEQLLSTTPIPRQFGYKTNYFSTFGDIPSSPEIDCVSSSQPTGNVSMVVWESDDGGPGRVGLVPASLTDSSSQYDDAYDKFLEFFDWRCTYGVDSLFVLAMQSFWEGLFEPSSLSASLKYGDGLRLDATVGPGWLQALYQNGRVTFTGATLYFEAIARAMTGVFRLHGSLGNPVFGTVMSSETCMRVRWVWLALPAVLSVLAILVLGATAIQSRRHTSSRGSERGRTPWKSSTMPLLWCGIADEVRTRYGALDSLHSMKGTARNVSVSLGRLGDGQERPWTLKEDRFWY